MACPSELTTALYERHADAWSSDRGACPFIEKDWLDRFLELQPDSPTILDLGCGAGQPIAGYFIERGAMVTGIDSSPMLLGKCRASLPTGRWIEADIRSLRLERQFNGIIAWDSLFHLNHAHQRQMFRVFAEHAAPHAALMFTSGLDHGVAMGSFRGEPLYHASLSEDEYRALLADCGFVVNAHMVEDPQCGQHTIWLATLR